MVDTFVMLIGLASIVFSHPVQDDLFWYRIFEYKCKLYHNGDHHGDQDKDIPGTKSDTRAQDPMRSQAKTRAGGNANGGNAQGNNDGAKSE